ncbi:MAG: hypothetical protein WB952_17930 [Terriglobales bacterium]
MYLIILPGRIGSNACRDILETSQISPYVDQFTLFAGQENPTNRDRPLN